MYIWYKYQKHLLLHERLLHNYIHNFQSTKYNLFINIIFVNKNGLFYLNIDNMPQIGRTAM